MKSNLHFKSDGSRIEFSGVLDLEDLADLTFIEYEQILLAEPADTAVHPFQVLETFWRAHERKFGCAPKVETERQI